MRLWTLAGVSLTVTGLIILLYSRYVPGMSYARRELLRTAGAWLIAGAALFTIGIGMET